jgi:hypothetical protein
MFAVWSSGIEMASVSEEVVREYFEINEFSVKVHRKFLLKSAERDELDEVDLVATNLKNVENRPINILLNKQDIQGIERAIVGVRGWHSETFSPARLKSSPEIFNLALLNEKKVSENFFKGQSFDRILVVPSLPADPDLKVKVLQTLQEKGLDFVLEFKTILEELIDHVQIHRNYAESPVLQILRILKRYDLIRDYQMELF